jgi:hypothetical protein
MGLPCREVLDTAPARERITYDNTNWRGAEFQKTRRHCRGGFAGLSCAGKLASNPAVETMLIDKNNYQEFQPLLYQVATGGVYMVDGAQTAH